MSRRRRILLSAGLLAVTVSVVLGMHLLLPSAWCKEGELWSD
jgi:hypothetical protein